MELNGVEKLFGAERLEAFDEGLALGLLRGRSRALGHLLSSEHAAFYIQILYRMLCFRRDYELEPLNDALYEGVRTAQGRLLEDGEYEPEKFNQHMNQLVEWGLVRRRIEKERLRGYRDMRRDKFRYALEDEALTFLLWLEDSLRQELEGEDHDTRNLLHDVLARLGWLERELGVPWGESLDTERARNVMHHFRQLDGLTVGIGRRLTALNVRLGTFLGCAYNADGARQVIGELEFYLSSYLSQVMQSRRDILSSLEGLGSGGSLEMLERCRERLVTEGLSPWLSGDGLREKPEEILDRLSSFYGHGGRMDELCGRINAAAMKVWGKLSAHLRELERKSSRLEDLRARLEEMSNLEPDEVPVEFFDNLLEHAQIFVDKQYWDEFEKAEPPYPRRESERLRSVPVVFMRDKGAGTGTAARSLDDSRLADLREWIAKRKPSGVDFRAGDIEAAGIEDFRRVLELGRRGILGSGRGLARIGYELEVGDEVRGVSGNGDCVLEFRDMLIRELRNGKRA